MANQKKITIPANGPGENKQMRNRVKARFTTFRNDVMFKVSPDAKCIRGLENDILGIIKEYDIADAMRGFEGRDK